ncbi:hypothetical protein E0Z10_g10062 [Xylaria hypoxylon]|uniref:Uncharacterized protein n=1 Tax=Xylaria hypoxylon TaxID=37992 RepID=A0A4Z0Y4L6_9PEZI|nr:hypothetical protein E0Z10_g10062 [Xylaria hypoxylon]
MRTTSSALVALFAVSSALAQTLPPSPTASVGCEPHGDHWHCDGPATATIATSTTATSATHDDHEESGTLAPSPTESVGCEPHGDHWHCDGPASTTSSAPATTTTHDHDDDDDDDHESTGTLAPSPTESVGCESHGDHWHCDGPAVTFSSTITSSSTVAASASTSATTSVATGGVSKLLTNGGVLAGGLLLALGI